MTSYLTGDCSNCSYDFSYNVVGCRTCHGIDNESLTTYYSDITQKRIQNQVRAPSSVYTMNLGVLNVSQQNISLNWNQSSDRLLKANSLITNPRKVPSRGNSTKSSVTRARPGASATGGQGVDIKHNSYARYLARLKGKNIRTQAPTGLTAKYGNKTRMFGMISNATCNCNPV